MSKIFVLGTGPLLEAGNSIMSGQCLRTWHFCAPLIANGHSVHLMTVPIPGTTEDAAEPPVRDAHYRDQPYKRLLNNAPNRILPIIQAEIEAIKPHAIVGVNAYPAFLLAELDRPEPFWADLNGWTMAEGQVRAAVVGHDREFGHFWRMEALTLLRGDRFSTVTDRQAHALYGEMAALGRLDHRNFEEDFATAVPNAVYPDYANLRRTAEMPRIIADQVPNEALICLWSGGFNSWTDIETLTAGMGEALQREKSLYFVCTGGAIKGHDEVTYKHFEQLAARRFPAGRCVQLGWVELADVLALHAYANVGINIDGPNVETRFGARNRLTNMLGAGLPVMTTRGTEIADWIERQELGCVFKSGDAAELAIALTQSVREATSWRLRAARARQRALSDFAPQRTLETFLRWIEKPAVARDKAAGPVSDAYSSTAQLRSWVHRRIKDEMPFAASAPPADHSSSGVARPAPVSRASAEVPVDEFRTGTSESAQSLSPNSSIWERLFSNKGGKR